MPISRANESALYPNRRVEVQAAAVRRFDMNPSAVPTDPNLKGG
ncbi:MAG: hypothetical protein ACXABY_17205 [Candidatus Thorarchaeota archaeon]